MLVMEQPNDEVLLVRQREHANLSAQIAMAWHMPDVFDPAVWYRFVEAVRRHDDGWADWDVNPTVDEAGRILDFKKVPTGAHTAVLERGFDVLAEDDDYIALMAVQHARWLYTHLHGEEAPEDARLAQKFIDGCTLRIAHLLQELVRDPVYRPAVQPGPLQISRRLLTFFDALSLQLIGAIRWQEQTEPLAWEDRVSPLTIREDRDRPHEVQIGPWPFRVDRVSLHIVGLRGPGKPHANHATQHLRWALRPI